MLSVKQTQNQNNSWDGKSNGGKLGYSIFIFLMRKAGLGATYMLLYFVASHFFIFLPRKTRLCYQFYRKRIGQSMLKSIISVYRNYYKFGQTLIDKIAAMSSVKTNFIFNFEGEDYLHKIVEQGKGGILVGGHLGNWEMAGHYLQRIQVSVNVVMYDNEYQKIKNYLDNVTSGKSFKVIAIKDDFSHIYEIGEALNNNELICIHADRHFENSKIIRQEFLGTQAAFSEGIFRLISLFEAPVTFVFAFKETRKHYHFYATMPKIYIGECTKKWMQVLCDFIQEFELKTKQYPLHWFNYYDFWK